AAGLDKLPFRFTGKEMDEETGLYYYGARYLDPKYSRWLSGDPALGEYIPQAPINDEAKKHNENLLDMGGVFNTVNLHVYHYAGNNPVKYTDPDGRLLINNVSENSASAREYERNHNLRYIAFLIKTLDAKGNAQIPIGNIDIILEKGLNKSLTLANAVKNNPNYVVDVKAIASETKNGNYQIDIDVLVFHYGADGKLVCDVNNSGTITFVDSSELGVFGPNSSIDQKLVNQKANEVINTVLHISNANLVGDK
ncbi:RHS repeat-associated core domain-containing protein, partial [Treponema denticola]|uniref:RHS repeat-associated core domain-containing protein n=1 Tax=Treponema denticola TaxID=158 RepID=UPI003D8A2BB7